MSKLATKEQIELVKDKRRMADIAKCSGMKVTGTAVCPLRFDCYRYRVEMVDPVHQSWIYAPFEHDRHGTTCEQFWKMEEP